MCRFLGLQFEASCRTLEGLIKEGATDARIAVTLGLAALAEGSRRFLEGGDAMPWMDMAVHDLRLPLDRGYENSALRSDLADALTFRYDLSCAAGSPRIEDLKEAVTHYERSLARVEADPVAWAGLGTCHLRLARTGDPSGAEFTAALKCLDRAIALDPKFPGAWNDRGMLHLDRGAVLERAGGDPDPEFAAALADFTHTVDLDGTLAAGWANRSRTLLATAGWKHKTGRRARGFVEEAERSAGRCVEVAPGFAMGWFLRGRARYGLKRYEEARSDFEQAVRLDPRLARDVAPYAPK